MTIKEYIKQLNERYKSGISREHSYRGDLQTLLQSMLPQILVTNEPARVDCGAPDYILTKNSVPVGYIEAKDIGDRLDGRVRHKEQFSRYKASLPNIIFTDYLDFHFYIDGDMVASVRIAEEVGGKIKGLIENFEKFEQLILNFASHGKQTVSSPGKLADLMAGKAKILAEVIESALTSDVQTQENTSLKSQMTAFKNILIHDIGPKQFADIYAQTIAYGMFTARLHDPNLDTFTRFETAVLIPKTNPFLRKLFQDVAGYDLDDRISWIVDELADLFRATNVKDLLKNFGKATQSQDPFIHFYETFLAKYDPKLRKSRGVWYTPEPVVKFIVRAVDEILKSEFNLPKGLADTSKTTIKVKVPTDDKRAKTGFRDEAREVHKVQILDPATGTGTFLAEVVKQVYSNFEGQQGIWSNYVESHLIPRLNGFEILMASYAMAHLKLDMLLSETGYKPTKDNRLRIYLTNSLEESHPDTGTLFASWLSQEASEADHIKRDTPVMVVLGNPPYSGESQNKGDWIMSLMEDYKKEPGGKEKLKERNSKWVNDDYVKFIRYAQHFIEKNGSGVIGFINPHSYLDNPTFRGMRWNLLKTFDKIYTIDLHGNTKKRETAPDGSKDENVFDIQQGVSINFFIKTGIKAPNQLGKIFHKDIYGVRENKYEYLLKKDLLLSDIAELPLKSPMYYMVQKNFELEDIYNYGFSINRIFLTNNVGVVTSKDKILVDEHTQRLIYKVSDYYKIEPNKDLVEKISYRPFDQKYVYYDTQLVERSRGKIMQHFLKGENIGLALCRQFKTGHNYLHVFITNKIIESSYVSNRTSEITSVFPLYLYPDFNGQQTIVQRTERTSNLNPEIVKHIAENLGLTFTPEKEETEHTFAPIDLLDYIYAVLHSPVYREKYKEFLKIDFPRVPYPKDQGIFWELVRLGGEIRQIHLLESLKVHEFITEYPRDGDNVITRKMTKVSPGFEMTDASRQTGRVWINEHQYFDSVPLVAWEFYIGGYQPAQKWLKDRNGIELSFEDIQHYQKIIVALAETDHIMKKIDQVPFMEI